jgi:transcriptional regulator with XRE-family HTH domain
MKNIGDNVQRIRMEKGWSQNDLATAMGYVAQSMISSIESGGRRNIRAKTVQRLAAALGCTTDALYEGVEFSDAR